MAHAHFLQMGGFKVNYIESNIFNYSEIFSYDINKKGTMVHERTLNFRNFRQLLEKRLIDFPETTAEEIEDRSKGDALSKGVALLQITWFIIQLIARAHQHLTITEIELTTAALAGLNSIMYLFWWNKPLDVRCPIIIRTKELERQLAEAKRAINGENESQNEGESGGEKWSFTRERFRLRDYSRDSPAWVALNKTISLCHRDWMRTIYCRVTRLAQILVYALTTHLRYITMWCLKPIRELSRLLPNWTWMRTNANPNVELLQRSDWTKKDVKSDIELQTPPVTKSRFGRVVMSIWTTAKLVVTKLFYLPYLLTFLPMQQILVPVVVPDRDGFSDARDKMHNKPALHLLFNEGDMEWIMSMMFYSERAETRPLLIFSALAGAAFGSIHCAAWHFDFPSQVEQILWRTASLTIIGLCLSVIAISPVYSLFVYDIWGKCYPGNPEDLFWTHIKKIVETPPAIIYPVARLSLLILALLSLRCLPPSAFDTVVWTKFLPHI